MNNDGGTSVYSAEEAEAILDAAPLLTETQVMARWQCKKRWLRALINGHHPKGIYLPAVRLSARELRFRARDVIKVEEQLRQST